MCAEPHAMYILAQYTLTYSHCLVRTASTFSGPRLVDDLLNMQFLEKFDDD